VNPAVAAIVTVEADLSYVAQTLDAVLSQSVLPSVIIIADCTASSSGVERFSLSIPSPLRTDGLPSLGVDVSVDLQIVPTPHAASFGDAVSKGIAAGAVRSTTSHLWLLHDDSRPVSTQALEMLLEADRNSPGAKLIGTKQVDWETGTLQNVGYFVSRRHRRVSLVVDGEEDQDQYNNRQDVFGVSLAGALVSRSTWMNLSGTDAWYGTFGEGIDFARRVYLSGGRVVVAPRVVTAHRRARFSGVRTREGEPLDAQTPRSAYIEQITARDRFASTENSPWKKPFLWIAWVFAAIGLFVGKLFAKEPYEAVCELLAPWRALARTPQSLSARMRLHHLPRQDRGRFASLVASRNQMAEWRERQKVFSAQRGGLVLSPLALDHLHQLRRRRMVWVLLLVLVGLAASVAMNWSVLGGVFAGSSLYSSVLVPTAASLPTVVKTATTMWSFSAGLGTAAAPLPFALVLTVLSAITGGHAAVAVSLFILLSPLLMMMSFWALAGVVTRSNPLRFSAALLWGVLPGLLGVYQTGQLPMLVVFVFLPVSFYLVFRAVGMYAVDEPRVPYSSIQAAALAGLSMTFVALSEPQLVIPFFLVFAAFLVTVRTHRAMLLLMPLPSIVVLMPTFFSMLVHFREGLWRQLFVDASVPDQSIQGAPGADGIIGRLRLAFASAFSLGSAWQHALAWILVAAACLVLVCALAALFVPSGLRLSRMAWVVAAAGAILGFFAPRVAVGMDSGEPVAASVLPAVAFLALGLLVAACAVTGKNDTAFLVTAEEMATVKRGSAGLGRLLRPTVAVVITLAAAVSIGIVAASWSAQNGLKVMNGDELPIIAAQDLEETPGARVLALFADSPTSVDYSVMRTPAGDLVDVNATTQIDSMLSANKQEDQLRSIAAKLLSDNDSTSIEKLTQMGFSGIYIPASTSTPRADLAAHVTASDGTEQVVDNSTGLYVRLSGAEQSGKQHINIEAETASYSDPLRVVWLVLMGIVVLAYLIVAIPRSRTFVQEEDR
jgi:GT2 family glycosyltransferase